MFSPATEHARATFPGLYVGQVEEVEKVEEQSEDKKFTHGRIKVSIPSVFDQEKPEDFVWARPCFPYGHFYVPEKKDKVWIAFENGDPKAPVWLGVWYPDGKAPPEAKASPPVRRVIHSAQGHSLVLDDDEDEATIALSHGDEKAKITLTGDTLEIAVEKHIITIDNEEKAIAIQHSNAKGKAVLSNNAVELSFGSSTITLNDSSISLKVGSTTTITLSASGIKLEGARIDLN